MKKIVTIFTCTVIGILVTITILVGTQQKEINAMNNDSNQINRQIVKKQPVSDQFIQQDLHTTQIMTEKVTKDVEEPVIDNKIEKKETTEETKDESEVKEKVVSVKKEDIVKEKEIPELTHEKIIELTDGFDQTLNKLLENLEDDFRVVDYTTKKEVEKAFLPYAKQGLATPYIDRYFEERDGALYGLPQDSPMWFEKELEYSLENVTNEKISLIQSSTTSALFGPYTINIEFENTSNQWKISQVTVNPL